MEDETNWSIAVYLAGGDGLISGMIRTLQELRDEATSGPGLAVVAQFEPGDRVPRRFGFPQKELSRAAGLTPSPAQTRAHSEHSLGSYEYLVDSARSEKRSSEELLRDFVGFAAARERAPRSMLVFSGHGNGAVGELFGFRGAVKALQIEDLSRVLSEERPHDRKLDIIGMDCCNMSMIEIAFELAPYARLLLASESVVPSYGWPYRQLASRIRDVSAEEAAVEIVRCYADFYADYSLAGTSTHCAATALDDIESLAAPVQRLADALRASIDHPDVWRPLVLAHWEAQSYKDEEYVDLADFCLRLYQHIPDDAVRTLCVDVMCAIGAVVRESRSVGAGFQYSTGLSVYFPWSHDLTKGTGEVGASSVLDQYKTLVFSQKTGWGEFLDAYLITTRRNDRAYRPRESTASFSPATELAARCVAP